MKFIHKYYSLIVLFLIISIIPLIFFNTTQSMINVWLVNETFTHGFLIFPITLWLIWQRRTSLLAIHPSSEPRVIILFVSILIFWFINEIAGVNVTQQLAMIAIIISLVWLILGRQILLHLLFPLLFLFFAVPLGQSLIPSLMEFTANFTVYLIKLTGIPIYQDGLYFSLPSGNWSVVEECSGVRYLIASIALGTIYAYISYTSNRKRLIFIFFAIVVPILANGLRAFGIVMIGHFSGMRLAVGADHLVYGWVFFGIVIFIMFYIGSFWWDPVEKPVKSSTSINSNLELKKPAYLFVLSLVFIFAIKMYAEHLNMTRNSEPVPHSIELSENFNGWQFDKERQLNWNPILKSTDLSVSRGYRNRNNLVQLNIGYYHHQSQGAEAVSSDNKLTNPYGGEWKITSESDYQHEQMHLSEIEIRRNNSKILIWQWYRLGQLQTPNPYIAKVFDAYNEIITHRTDASYITISTIFEDSKSESRKRLSDFLNNSLNEINMSLEKASGH